MIDEKFIPALKETFHPLIVDAYKTAIANNCDFVLVEMKERKVKFMVFSTREVKIEKEFESNDSGGAMGRLAKKLIIEIAARLKGEKVELFLDAPLLGITMGLKKGQPVKIEYLVTEISQ